METIFVKSKIDDITTEKSMEKYLQDIISELKEDLVHDRKLLRFYSKVIKCLDLGQIRNLHMSYTIYENGELYSFNSTIHQT